MKTNPIIAIASLLIVMGLYEPVPASGFDHSRFDAVLRIYVNDKGLVDYNGIAGDPTFKAYMESLQTAKPDTMSRD